MIAIKKKSGDQLAEAQKHRRLINDESWMAAMLGSSLRQRTQTRSADREDLGMRSGSSSIVGIVWVVIGLIVASGHAFFAHLNAVMPILSAILAVLLWPLVLLGVDLHLH